MIFMGITSNQAKLISIVRAKYKCPLPEDSRYKRVSSILRAQSVIPEWIGRSASRGFLASSLPSMEEAPGFAWQLTGEEVGENLAFARSDRPLGGSKAGQRLQRIVLPGA
jgi:hypothetical protein